MAIFDLLQITFCTLCITLENTLLFPATDNVEVKKLNQSVTDVLELICHHLKW